MRFEDNGAAIRLDPGQDEGTRIDFASRAPIGAVIAQHGVRALVNDRRKASVVEPLGVDRGLCCARVEGAVLAGRHIHQVQRRVGRVVHIHAGNHREHPAIGRYLDIADLAGRFHHARHAAIGQVDDMDALGSVFVIDVRRRCALHDAETSVARDLETG